MSASSWLSKLPEFSEIDDETREAVFHFLILWSLFESRALSESASAKKIIGITETWWRDAYSNSDACKASLGHFQRRYCVQDSCNIDGLKLRKNDEPELVKAVLDGSHTEDSAAALLIIIYRIRNNLFHGLKWQYGLKDQLDNLTHANKALMVALDKIP